MPYGTVASAPSQEEEEGAKTSFDVAWESARRRMNSAHRRGKVTFFVPKKVSRCLCTKDFFVRFVDSILIRDELSYISHSQVH